MPRTPQPRDAAVFGIDLGKNIFHVVSTDASGVVAQRLKFRRDKVLAFFRDCCTRADRYGSLPRLAVARPQASGYRAHSSDYACPVREAVSQDQQV